MRVVALLMYERAGATHFMTGDKKHFKGLYFKSIAGVLILKPKDYLSLHE